MSWYLRCLRKYAVFRGRARQQEFFMFEFLNELIAATPFVVGTLFPELQRYMGLLWATYRLATLMPLIAVGVRRLHDTDHSGWWALVPIANVLLWFLEGTPGDNRFGPDPRATAPQAA